MTFAEAIAQICNVREIYRKSWPDHLSIYYDAFYDELMFKLILDREDLEATDWEVTK